jgi:hypothetical protein
MFVSPAVEDLCNKINIIRLHSKYQDVNDVTDVWQFLLYCELRHEVRFKF